MTTTTDQTPLLASKTNDLRKIAKGIYLIERQNVRQEGSRDPDTILVFGWMNGKLNHVQKYTDKYRSLYPSAQILVVQSYSDWFWSSKKSKDAYAQPILRFLDAEKLSSAQADAPPKQLFVHSFSNGGAIVLSHLAEMASKRQIDESMSTRSQQLSLDGLILDSAPGTGALRGLLRAFTAGITNPILRYPIYALLTTVWSCLRLYILLARPKPFAIDKLRQDLNDGRIFPLAAKRLYIYSKTDELIRPEDVESNIAAARQAGIDVSVEKYEKSPHVAHARTDGNRYWTAVTKFWGSC